MTTRSVKLEVILGLKDQASKGLKSTEGNLGKLNTRLKGMRTQLLLVSAAFVGFAVASVKAASDLEESLQAAEVTFKDAFVTVEDFAENTAAAFNLSKRAAFEYTAQLGGIFNASGLAADASAEMSVEATKLAADLASFKNLEIDVALQKIRAGLVGEVEPLRTVGVLLNAASVEAKAMELGLADVNGEISEGAKVQARFAVIMEQLADAQGDVARTSDSVANLARNVTQQFEDMRAEVGTRLLPVVSDLLNVMGGLLETFTAAPKPIQDATVAIGGLTAAMVLLALVTPTAITAIGRLRTALLFLVANPIVAAIAGITAGLVLLTGWFLNLKDEAERTAEGVGRLTEEMKDFRNEAVLAALGAEGFTETLKENDLIAEGLALSRRTRSREQIRQTEEEAAAAIQAAEDIINAAEDIINAKKSETEAFLAASELKRELFQNERERNANIQGAANAEALSLQQQHDANLIAALEIRNETRRTLDREAADEAIRVAKEIFDEETKLLAAREDAAQALVDGNRAAFEELRRQMLSLPEVIQVGGTPSDDRVFAAMAANAAAARAVAAGLDVSGEVGALFHTSTGGPPPGAGMFGGEGSFEDALLTGIQGKGIGFATGAQTEEGFGNTFVFNIGGSFVTENDINELVRGRLHDLEAARFSGLGISEGEF